MLNCGNLGVCDSNELLGGWLTDATKAVKSAARSTASAIITTAKASQVPVISQGASLIRAAGNTASAQQTPSGVQVDASGNLVNYGGGAKIGDSGSSNTALFVVGGIVLLAILAAKK